MKFTADVSESAYHKTRRSPTHYHGQIKMAKPCSHIVYSPAKLPLILNRLNKICRSRSLCVTVDDPSHRDTNIMVTYIK